MVRGRDPEIAGAPNAAARQRRIAALKTSDPALHAAFLEARRAAEGASHMVRSSGAYPLCGRGDVNTYPVFVELNRRLMGGEGASAASCPRALPPTTRPSTSSRPSPTITSWRAFTTLRTGERFSGGA
jgi:hypothetical protein